MPTIVGIPAGKMIRTSVNSDTDDLGLTRLTESYAFATSEFQTFRTRLTNFTPYNTIMAYVYPTPSTTYPYVVVESVSIQEDNAGISIATIQYHGILNPTVASAGDTSWLPPAKQKIQPLANSSINPLSIIVDFIYYSDSINPTLDVIKKYGEGTSLPISINGINLYRSITAPYKQETQVPLTNIVAGLNPNPFAVTNVLQINSYLGMLCTSHFSEIRGLFFKITNTYEDVFTSETVIL
jgi:hypothetical protein